MKDGCPVIDDELTPAKALAQMMSILHADLPRLLKIDRYIHGHHDDPYIPDSAGPEYRLLVKRAVTNWMPLIIGAPAQSLYVDSVRPGRPIPREQERDELPEWEHWQLSRLDSRQSAVYRGALGYGHSFTVTEHRGKKVQSKGLSPLRTSALFADPANDETPVWAFTVAEWPGALSDGLGLGYMWSETNKYAVHFEHLWDTENVIIRDLGPHGASSNPVTRFAAQVDLDGRTLGVVEPLIVLQDRLNQTVFDLLVIQTGGAFKVKTVTGMEPPYQMTYEIGPDGEPKLVPLLNEETGEPVLQDVQINAMRLLWAENEDTRFGTLEETPLDGYLAAIEACTKAIAALSQTPPHYLVMGTMANLSADALQAAETALERKVAEFRQLFGESWERVFRLAAELSGVDAATDDYKIEVVWRDMEARSLNKAADGLLKLRQIGAPARGLFEMIPGITKTTLFNWEDYLADENMTESGRLADELGKISATRRPVTAPPPQDEVP